MVGRITGQGVALLLVSSTEARCRPRNRCATPASYLPVPVPVPAATASPHLAHRPALPCPWQVDAVIAACSHRDCVRALFSATLPEAVENLARSVLKDPLRVTVGERNTGEAARQGGAPGRAGGDCLLAGCVLRRLGCRVMPTRR